MRVQMRQLAWTIVILGVIIVIALADAQPAQAAATLYVAADGSDAWSGTLPQPKADRTDGPFATLTRARDAVRQLKQAGPLQAPVTVMIRGGVYELTEPLILTPADSGTRECPISYVAYPGEKPIISGGRVITGWQKGEGELWTVEIPEVKSGQWYFRQVFANGRRAARARLPREGFYAVAELPPEAEQKDPQTLKYFQFEPGDIANWEDIDQAELVLFRSWDEARLRIAEVDEQTNTVAFTSTSGRLFNWLHGQVPRYYVENVLAGLTGPGQWYLDRPTGVLYYWPLPGEDMTEIQVVAPVIEQLVRLEGDPGAEEFVEHIILRGLTFCHSAWTFAPDGYPGHQSESGLSAAIYAHGTHSCAIEDSEIAHIGLYAIEFGRGCRNNRIVRNRIHDIGAGGIKIGEGKLREPEAEQTGGNVVTDNYIYDLGNVFLCGVGVLVRQSGGNVVSHNEIRDLNYTGISVGWTWGYGPSLAGDNIIEYNHIYNIGRGLLSDMGGIYTLGLQPGTRLRYNLIHDVESYSYGGWGLYTDEGSTDILLENNVVYNTKTGGFHQHYGRDNIIRNNIFAFSREGQIIRSREEDHVSFTFERNIVYFDTGKLLGGRWTNGNFRLDNNLYWDTSGAELDFVGKTLVQWQAQGYDQHSLIADPLFVDPDKRNFTLKPDSPAFELGFEPIDLSNVGPRAPEDRQKEE